MMGRVRQSPGLAAWQRRATLLVASPAVGALSCSLLINSDALSDGGQRGGAAGATSSAGAPGAGGSAGAEPRGGATGTAGATGVAGALAAAGCRGDEKVCQVAGEPRCVSTSAPGVGCAGSGCDPCDLANAVADCGFQGACRVSTCVDPYRDCDGDSSNGCEVNVLTSRQNCGDCNTPCPGTCTDGTCG